MTVQLSCDLHSRNLQFQHIWQQQIVETQSRYGGVYGLPSKHAEGSVKGMLLFLANLRRVSKSNMDIASVQSDGGSEFTGALSKYCLEQGISVQSGRQIQDGIGQSSTE